MMALDEKSGEVRGSLKGKVCSSLKGEVRKRGALDKHVKTKYFFSRLCRLQQSLIQHSSSDGSTCKLHIFRDGNRKTSSKCSQHQSLNCSISGHFCFHLYFVKSKTAKRTAGTTLEEKWLRDTFRDPLSAGKTDFTDVFFCL